MVLPTLKLRNGFFTNHDPKHSINQTQIKKNHQNLKIFASIVEKINLSNVVSNKKLKKSSSQLSI